MKKIFKGFGLVLFALTLVVGVGAGQVNATLTVAALSVTSNGALTVSSTGAVALTIAPVTTSDATGTIVIGATDGTGLITVGSSTAGQTVGVGTGNVVGSDIVNIGTGTATVRKTVNIATGAISTVNVGTGNFVNTIHIGDNASPANLITIGGAASTTTVKGALTVGVDATGHDVTFYGDTASANLLWDESADALELAGVARLDLSGATVLAANTDGGVIKAGTLGAPVTEDTADMKFVSLYFDNGATSGDNRGIYNRLELTGAGGGGESLRSYTELTVAAGTAHGAHISLGMGESTTVGSVTGLGVGVRSTLGLPDGALPAGGTYAAMMPEIYSFGASSDAGAVTELSFIRAVNGGNATGAATVDDDAALFSLQGFTSGTGKMIEVGTGMGTVIGTIKIKIGGTLYYIPYYSTPG